MIEIRIAERLASHNVCALSVRADADVPEVHFAAHPHGGAETLWFRFAVQVVVGRAGPVRLVLEHIGNMLGASDPGAIWPVISAGEGGWRRLPPGRPRLMPDGRVSALWDLDLSRGEHRVEIAFCYPYGPSDLNGLLADVGESVTADEIGVTQSGRPLPRLSTDYGSPGGETDGVYLIARQHSGETPGSWVLDGLLRAASAAPSGPAIWAIPFAHMDGVVQGDYGKDGYPYDLNRAWGAPPMRHETLVIQRDICLWTHRFRPRLALDLHAPGACETDGVYAFLPQDAEDGGEEYRWAEALREAIGPPYAAEQFIRKACYPSRWPTPCFTSHMKRVMGVPALTLETPYGVAKGRVLTVEDYREIGARVHRVLGSC